MENKCYCDSLRQTAGLDFLVCENCGLKELMEKDMKLIEVQNVLEKIKTDREFTKKAIESVSNDEKKLFRMFMGFKSKGHKNKFIDDLWCFYLEYGYITEWQINKVLDIVFQPKYYGISSEQLEG